MSGRVDAKAEGFSVLGCVSVDSLWTHFQSAGGFGCDFGQVNS